jgi:transposase
MTDPRQERGRAIAERSRIQRQDDSHWRVPSQSSPATYTVQVVRGEWSCSCPDFETRQLRCKHTFAVEFSMMRVETNEDGSVTTTTVSVKAERKTYRQPWTLYNLSQVNERKHFLGLLADLCNLIPEPAKPENSKGGRPPIPLRDAIFAAVFKVFSLTSARRFSGELAEAHEAGYIDHCPHFNSVLSVFDKEETTEILRNMIAVSALPLKAVEQDFAVDSTGFATTKYTSWFDHKWGKERSKAVFIKTHFITGVKTNVVPAVDIFEQHTNDSPCLPALVNATAKNFTVNEVSADAAYPGSPNFDAVEAHGAKLFAAFRSNTTGGAGGSFAKAFHYFQFQRDEYLAHYHKRSNVESTVSMVKRRYGDSVKAKNELAQKNEVYAKFVCHNLCVLIQEMYILGINPIFGETTCTNTHEPAQILRFPGR